MSAIEEWRPVVGFEGIFASWMATADGCDCGNLQPPKVVIPSTLPGMAFHAFYRCADAQRINGHEFYRCCLDKGHDGPHRWPTSGRIAEWSTT